MANSEEQMSFLFEEGGIADDGMTADPVSGNEVPPGSLASEVRDDIPAQLSPGEYVVPADVLRFYGVKFFEDLRLQAKQGLMDMESNGRIGGTPIPTDTGALTPEEIAALEEIGYNIGGYVAQPTQSNMGVADASPVAVGNTGFAEGGVSTGEEPTFTAADATKFAPGFLIDQIKGADPVTTTEPVTTVMLYSPTGSEVRALTLPTDQEEYDRLVASGWTKQQTEVTTQTSVGQGDDRDIPDAVDTSIETWDVNSIPEDKLASTAKSMALVGNIASVLAGQVGLPARAIVNTASVAKYNDIIDRMNRLGIEHEFDRKGSVFGGEAGLLDNLQDIDGDGKVSFADTWLGDMLGFDAGGSGVQGPGLQQSWGGSRRTPTPAKAPATKAPTKTPTQTAPTDTGGRDVEWSGGAVASNQAAPDSGRSAAEAQADAQAAADRAGVGMATRGR